MKNTTGIDGKVAVVTGGGGILCSEMAKELARQGASVAILDLQLSKAQEVADEINKSGGRAIGVEGNVLSKESLQRAKITVNEAFGACNILINGAGGNHPSGTTTNEQFVFEDINDETKMSFFGMEAEGFGFVFNLNFIGTLFATQVFAKDFLDETCSTVINISSMSSFTPLTKVPAYSAAKAAINNFTMWLAVHFASSNIRVNAIAPGFFLTDQNRELLVMEDGSYTPRSKKILNHTPMNRFGAPQDLLGAVSFLADNTKSGFITGIVLPVDGGFMAYSGI